MSDLDKLRGRANQDQELAEVADMWRLTDADTSKAFVEWLAMDDPASILEFLNSAPPSWVAYIQKCCLVGLREAVLQSM